MRDRPTERQAARIGRRASTLLFALLFGTVLSLATLVPVGPAARGIATAFAHADLLQADPQPGTTLQGAPRIVHHWFSEEGMPVQVALVTRVRVSINTHQVTLQYEPDHVALRQLEERLGVLGYPVARPQRGKPLPIHALAVQSRGSTRITNVPVVSRSEYAEIAARRASTSARGSA